MPTYAYACKDCGHEFDIHQSFSDDALTVCPVCSGTLRKKFNSVGVVFKGSGFYRTDSRSGSTAGAPAASPAKESTTTGSGDGSSAASSATTSTSSSSASSAPSAPATAAGN